MKQPKYITDTLTVLRARIDTRDPAHRSSDGAREGLEQARIYLNSWVLPLLDILEDDDSLDTRALRASIAREAAAVRCTRRERTCRRCGNSYGNTDAFTTRTGTLCRWCSSDSAKPRKRSVHQVLHEAERTYEMPNAVRGALRLATMTLEEIAREISKTREEHRLAVEIRTAQLLGALGISCDYTGERR